MSILKRALGAQALVLWARGLLRAVPAVVVTACAAMAVAGMLGLLVPGVLTGDFPARPLPLLMSAAIAGALLGGWSRRRALRRPSVREAALALESRLTSPDATLSTAFDARGDWSTLIVERARAQLQAALRAPAPGLLPTRALVALPLALVCAVALAALVLELPQEVNAPVQPRPGTAQRVPGVIDVATGRDAADAAQAAHTAGMQRAAEALSKAATTLQRSDATNAARAADLQAARDAVAQLPDDVSAPVVPAGVPDSAPERAVLAQSLSAAAGALRAAAEEGATGQGSGGGEGDVEARLPRVLVPVPRPAPVNQGSEVIELIGQSPARRALVARALAALED